ncbi:hypothetical protein KBC55_01250 [Patescibacteria group bacterium]|jgi:hypothetical protein|nr:hypothetical protein [Patescibacteria group bacterium]
MRSALLAWQQAIAAIRDPFHCEIEVIQAGQPQQFGHMHQIGFRDARNNLCSDATGNVDRIVATYGTMSISEVAIRLDDTRLPRVEGDRITYEDEHFTFVLRPEARQHQPAA